MKKGFQESFDHLKKMINQNVDLLRNLIKQSEKLAKIIENIPDSDESMGVTKNNLKKTRVDIEESIDGLIKKTEELFDFYNQLMREAFKN